MFTKEKVGPLRRLEIGLLSTILTDYGWKVYTRRDNYIITSKECKTFEEVKEGTFIFIKFISESFCIIGLHKKGFKVHLYETMNMKVLTSKDDVRFIFTEGPDLVFLNKTNADLDFKNLKSYDFNGRSL